MSKRFRISEFDPPSACVFAWRVLELKEQGVSEDYAMAVADVIILFWRCPFVNFIKSLTQNPIMSSLFLNLQVIEMFKFKYCQFYSMAIILFPVWVSQRKESKEESIQGTERNRPQWREGAAARPIPKCHQRNTSRGKEICYGPFL